MFREQTGKVCVVALKMLNTALTSRTNSDVIMNQKLQSIWIVANHPPNLNLTLMHINKRMRKGLFFYST